MKRVFIDTNILLDVYQKRIGFNDSLHVLRLCEEKTLKGYITAASVYTCVYFLEGRSDLRQRIRELLQIMEIAHVSRNVMLQALQTSFRDIEDAFQYQAALNVSAVAIITRNSKHFSASNLPVFTPAELLENFNKQ